MRTKARRRNARCGREVLFERIADPHWNRSDSKVLLSASMGGRRLTDQSQARRPRFARPEIKLASSQIFIRPEHDFNRRPLAPAHGRHRIFGETANEPHSHAGYAHEGPHMHTKAPQAARPHTHIALDGMLELNGEWHETERRAGAVNPNSGGNTIYLSPGLRLTVENWSGAGFPILNELNGIQPTPAWRVIGGIAVVFDSIRSGKLSH
jgi:hypothetical protein